MVGRGGGGGGGRAGIGGNRQIWRSRLFDGGVWQQHGLHRLQGTLTPTAHVPLQTCVELEP